jgi:hypothetical protein
MPRRPVEQVRINDKRAPRVRFPKAWRGAKNLRQPGVFL